MKKPKDFTDYNEYIDYLIDENKKRMGAQNNDCLEFVKTVLNTTVSKQNKKPYDRFISMLKKSVEFDHNRIQYLSIDHYNCRGTPSEGTTLLNEIIYPCFESECQSMGKIRQDMEILKANESYYYGETNPSQSEINQAKILLKEERKKLRESIFDEKPYFEQFVSIDESMTNNELYVLIHISHAFEMINK